MPAIFFVLLIFLTGTAHAQASDKNFSAEARIFADDATPEILLRYKNFSADWIRRDRRENFFKLRFSREVISLMGSGIDWHGALNFYDGKFLPSVGANFYMRIRPRVEVGFGFSAMTFGRRGHFTDFETGVKYFPQKNFSIGAGWRRVAFKSRATDFVHSGAFVGVRYDF